MLYQVNIFLWNILIRLKGFNKMFQNLSSPFKMHETMKCVL
jgi:hypothetical protein